LRNGGHDLDRWHNVLDYFSTSERNGGICYANRESLWAMPPKRDRRWQAHAGWRSIQSEWEQVASSGGNWSDASRIGAPVA